MEWENVSAPLFWRWHVGYLIQDWYGVGPWIKEALPIYTGNQRRENNPSVSIKVNDKMSKLVSRGYIIEVVILALASLLYVPKGTYDIRMEFDATVSRINDSLWASNFIFPSMGSLLMMVGPETYMVDIDSREIFYNF